jgi:hypothetical protein
MFELTAGNSRQALGERVGFFSSVGFDVTDDDVAPGFQLVLRRFEHGVGLAHAGAHAEEHLEPAAFSLSLFALNRCEQCVGIGTLRLGHTIILTSRLGFTIQK